MDCTKTLRDARRNLGEVLWRLAVRVAEEHLTIGSIEEAIARMKRRRRSVNGSTSVRAIARSVHETALTLAAAQEAEKLSRIGLLLPGDRIWEELLQRTTREVGALAKRCFGREGASVYMAAGFAERPGDIRCRVERSETLSSCGEDAGVRIEFYDYYSLRVGLDWLRCVSLRGLAVVDGALTLSAIARPGPAPGLELFEARRASRGRGRGVRNETGFIARDTHLGITAWGSDAFAAIEALQERREAAKATQIHSCSAMIPMERQAPPRAHSEVRQQAGQEGCRSTPAAPRTSRDAGAVANVVEFRGWRNRRGSSHP